MNDSKTWVRVWDPVVRVGHWTLVAAFFTAYLTEDDLLTAHVWAGYVVAGVVAVRLLWGLAGTRWARFSTFVCSPRAVLNYLSALARGQAPRYLGHNPAGGAMIVALLLALSITAASGLIMDVYHIEGVWEELHEVFANLTLFLVIVHVAGVVLSSLAHRENLIRAMITGRKLADPRPDRR